MAEPRIGLTTNVTTDEIMAAIHGSQIQIPLSAGLDEAIELAVTAALALQRARIVEALRRHAIAAKRVGDKRGRKMMDDLAYRLEREGDDRGE